MSKISLDTQEVAGGCGKPVCCCVLVRSPLGITSCKVVLMTAKNMVQLLPPFGLSSDVSGYCSVAFIAWFTVLGALGLLPKDCWRQWLKSGGVAVLSGALVGQRGRRGMMLFLFCKVERNNPETITKTNDFIPLSGSNACCFLCSVSLFFLCCLLCVLQFLQRFLSPPSFSYVQFISYL